jgi:hypothetical protein
MAPTWWTKKLTPLHYLNLILIIFTAITFVSFLVVDPVIAADIAV